MGITSLLDAGGTLNCIASAATCNRVVAADPRRPSDRTLPSRGFWAVMDDYAIVFAGIRLGADPPPRSNGRPSPGAQSKGTDPAQRKVGQCTMNSVRRLTRSRVGVERAPRWARRFPQSALGRFTHVASIAIERGHAEEALTRSQAQLARAQRLNTTGSFSYRAATDGLTLSEETCRTGSSSRFDAPTGWMSRTGSGRSGCRGVFCVRSSQHGQARAFTSCWYSWS
jgi:hypothetical protein